MQIIGGLTQTRDNNEMPIILIIVLSLLGAAPSFAAPGSAGAAKAIDGDTLSIAGRVMDLFAIAAPAPDQVCREWARQRQRDYQCGAHARAFLASLIAGRHVECLMEDPGGDGGKGNRGAAATCYAAGQDVGLAMVRAGWALAARRQSDRYVSWEDAARQSKAGLWGGSFAPPGKAETRP